MECRWDLLITQCHDADRGSVMWRQRVIIWEPTTTAPPTLAPSFASWIIILKTLVAKTKMKIYLAKYEICKS